jgi:hypothetical protein
VQIITPHSLNTLSPEFLNAHNLAQILNTRLYLPLLEDHCLTNPGFIIMIIIIIRLFPSKLSPLYHLFYTVLHLICSNSLLTTPQQQAAFFSLYKSTAIQDKSEAVISNERGGHESHLRGFWKNKWFRSPTQQTNN